MFSLILFILFRFSNAHLGLDLQRFDEEIDANNPNYELLNEGLFRAANEMRVQYGLEPFRKNSLLQKVAESHAQEMIDKNFYNHRNPYVPALYSVVDRVNFYSANHNSFSYIAENIAHYDIFDEQTYCVKKQQNGKYYFFNCRSRQRMPIMTYKGLARSVLKGWMESEGHRENLLNPNYIYLGTAARLSKNPYDTKNPPFARLVENFGG